MSSFVLTTEGLLNPLSQSKTGSRRKFQEMLLFDPFFLGKVQFKPVDSTVFPISYKKEDVLPGVLVLCCLSQGVVY